MARRKKLVIIGIDSVPFGMIDEMVKQGHLPAMARLIREGCFTQSRSYHPNETGTNWCVLATGAFPMTTGVNMGTHLAGTPLNQFVPGFPSGLVKAEQIWRTAAKAGKRSIVFDYPQSYPVNAENVIHIGEDGRPDSAIRALSEVKAYVTIEPQLGPANVGQWKQHGIKIELRPAEGWKNVPVSVRPVLAAELPILPGPRSEVKDVKPLHALVWPGAEGYDRVSVHARKDANRRLIEVRLGEWSAWVQHKFETASGTVRAGLRAKLLKLSPDASDFHLYFSQIYPTETYSTPPNLAKDLSRRFGPYTTQPSRQQVVQGGASDVKTYVEEIRYQADWFAKAASYVMTKKKWGLFIMKWHGSDWTNHLCAYMLDPFNPIYDPARKEEGWRFWVDILSMGDRIVGAAMEAAGDNAILAVMSDHGGGYSTPVPKGPDVNALLAEKGFIARTPNGIDWPRTRAWHGGHHYVWLNVKGRDPQGIVEPGGEYESLRKEIIAILRDAKTPQTGEHRFSAVWPIEEAAMLGVGGDRVGDIFLIETEGPRQKITREEFERQYPNIPLGTWDWPRANSGAHTHDPFMIMCGPGFRKGYRHGKTPWVSAFAPTLCHAWGIPAPANADGAVIWEFLE